MKNYDAAIEGMLTKLEARPEATPKTTPALLLLVAQILNDMGKELTDQNRKLTRIQSATESVGRLPRIDGRE